MAPSSSLDGASSDHGLVGGSPAIRRVLRIIEKLKNDTSPVLILGESGVGKELVARAVHRCSPLARKAFVAVDSASLVSNLAEAELFGYEPGAFTGAQRRQMGLVRAADGGALFLDEIGELPLQTQAKLLRLLQQQEVRPLGSHKTVKVCVRVLAATNRDLSAAVANGAFRPDLYYRLNVIKIQVPPLRERKEDIPTLARHFVKKYALTPLDLSPEAVHRLIEYPWPGNVRELEHTVRRAVALRSGSQIRLADLPSPLRGDDSSEAGPLLPLAEMERRHILRVLQHTRGDIETASHILGVSRATIYRKLRAYGVGPAEFGGENAPRPPALRQAASRG